MNVEVVEVLPETVAAAVAAFRTRGGFETLAVDWTLLMHDANPGRLALRWVIARRGQDVRAVATAHIVRRLALGEYVGGKAAWLTDACRRIGRVPLSFDVAYMEIPLLNQEGLFFAPDADSGERAKLARAMITAFDAELPADAVCVKETIGRESGGTEGLRFATLPFTSRYVLELAGDTLTEEAWLANRSATRRATIRRNIRIFEATGAVLETLTDPAAHASRLAELLCRTAAQARERGEIPMPMDVGPLWFERFPERMGGNGLVRVVRVGDEIVAFSVLVLGHDTLFWRFVGLDYIESHSSRSYFRLVYDAVQMAVLHRLRFVDMGTGTAHVKLPLGCTAVPTHYCIRFRRRLRHIGPLIAALLDRRFRSLTHNQASVPLPEPFSGRP